MTPHCAKDAVAKLPVDSFRVLARIPYGVPRESLRCQKRVLQRRERPPQVQKSAAHVRSYGEQHPSIRSVLPNFGQVPCVLRRQTNGVKPFIGLICRQAAPSTPNLANPDLGAGVLLD